MSSVLIVAARPGAADGAAVDALVRTLRHEEYDVTVGASPSQIHAAAPDLLVVDVGGLAAHGAELCRDARASFDLLPILVIGDSGEECDVVECLDAGADDYVARPYRLAELLARVRSLLRRGMARDLPVRGVRVDAGSRRAWAQDKELSLTGKEFDLLRVFATHAGQVVSRESIMRELWGPQWWGSAKTLDMHVSSLRRKLGDGGAITTVRGVGFRLECDGGVRDGGVRDGGVTIP